jgi:DNA-binding MarR family transcriptional regulator
MAGLKQSMPDPVPLPFLLNRLMAAWNARLDARLRGIGAGFAQWRVLLALTQAGRPMTIASLSEATMVAHSTLSRQLDAMQRDGAVTRTISSGDRRAVEIGITPHGAALYARMRVLAMEETEAGLSGLAPAQVAALRTIIAHIAEGIGLSPPTDQNGGV